MIVVVEGIDGAGKSTVLRHVVEGLSQRGISATLIDKHDVAMSTAPDNRRVDCVRELIWGIETEPGTHDRQKEAYFKYLIIAAWYRLLVDYIVETMRQSPREVILLDGWYFRHIIKTHLRTGMAVDTLYAIVEPMVAAITLKLKIFIDTSPGAAATRKDFSDHEVGYFDGFDGYSKLDAFIRYQSRIRQSFLKEFPDFQVVEEAEKRTAPESAKWVIDRILLHRGLSHD